MFLFCFLWGWGGGCFGFVLGCLFWGCFYLGGGGEGGVMHKARDFKRKLGFGVGCLFF